jgi:hypothetical protein
MLAGLFIALGFAVRADAVDLGTAALILGPLAGGLILRAWWWVVVCVTAFTALVLALLVDDSTADALRLSSNVALREALGTDNGDMANSVRQKLPPGAPDDLPVVGKDSLNDILGRPDVRARRSRDASPGELLDAAAVVAVFAAGGIVVGKGVGLLVKRARMWA